MLLLERQVLKKRVKRDFLEFSISEQPGAAAWQPTGQPGGRPRVQQPQLLRPPGNQRPAHHQYTRPANQAPANRNPAVGQRPMARPPPPLPLDQIGRQQADLLEAAASSPSGLLFQQQQQATQMPPFLNPGAGAGRAKPVAGNATLSQVNQTRPFNDPSWPLMWYLVSNHVNLVLSNRGGDIFVNRLRRGRQRSAARQPAAHPATQHDAAER